MRASVAIIALSLLLAGCQTAPVTGRQQLILMSDQEASAMGLQAYDQILQEKGVANDPQKTALVRQVGERIVKVTPLANLDWQINLINDDTPNAFALPGGYIGVNTGLFTVAQNEAQLAAVLGHEVGHVVAHHPAERISRQMMVETGLGVVGGVTPELVNIASSAATLGLILPFSREQEAEADAIGLQYMARAGYDPREAVKLWQNFAAAGSGGTPEFMSTHPAPGNRIANLEAQMPEALKLYEASKTQ
jgi:metalloendopeptidase OMA1, mitochondrial